MIARDYEGLVAKDEARLYEAGRTRRWLKAKQKGWTVEQDRWQDRAQRFDLGRVPAGCDRTDHRPPRDETVGVKVSKRLLARPRDRHDQLRRAEELVADVADSPDARRAVDTCGAITWQTICIELLTNDHLKLPCCMVLRLSSQRASNHSQAGVIPADSDIGYLVGRRAPRV